MSGPLALLTSSALMIFVAHRLRIKLNFVIAGCLLSNRSGRQSPGGKFNLPWNVHANKFALSIGFKHHVPSRDFKGGMDVHFDFRFNSSQLSFQQSLEAFGKDAIFSSLLVELELAR